MDAEWSVEAGQDDPVVIVPWAAPDGSLQFVDIRSDPGCVNQIAEAQAHPALKAALVVLNAPEGELWTAKCDTWALDSEQREAVALELDEESTVDAGFGCYLDVLARDAAHFSSFRAHELLAKAWAHSAKAIPAVQSRSEFVVRPALVNRSPGFAITVYLWVLGSDTVSAYRTWESALEQTSSRISAVPISSQDVTMSVRASSSIG